MGGTGVLVAGRAVGVGGTGVDVGGRGVAVAWAPVVAVAGLFVGEGETAPVSVAPVVAGAGVGDGDGLVPGDGDPPGLDVRA
ncbi:MAG: hypothetical protein KJ048_18970, partial [Dehalococcoidia bacterium]|nr:hypothetical protein [Dehalococcoidia bacterium]